jgi:hypothetical protein
MIKFGDRVRVISTAYACANLGDEGKIVDNGYPTPNNLYRYLVRWDSSPNMLWGVHSDSIERIEE